MARYETAADITPSTATALADYPALLQKLLQTRGITTATAADLFLSPSYDDHLHDPWLLHDMSAAVERIVRALEAEETIVIYSDYDCDGIPGGVVLHDLFRSLGHEHFTNYIPHRHFDGFGLHEKAVTELAAQGAQLLITVDCGTTDGAAVERARELGVDVIITDHHQPGEQLPPAVAVVNPQVGSSYPFPDLCGAAVAFKLAQAVLEKTEHNLAPGQEKWWLDMVGLATVADMVPLIGENRVLAHYGLKVLQKTRRPGLQQLLRKQRVQSRYLTEDDIGFTIGPRINAASRMDTPEDAFWMLASSDESEAGSYVAHLESLNNERKGIVASMTREAHKKLKTQEVPEVIVLGSPEWRPSLVGLVANKLAEEYSRPAFVWGRDGNGVLKGSARSGGTVSVHAIMGAAAAAFTEYGGHHFSGGFSVKESAIHTLAKTLETAYASLDTTAAAAPTVTIDHVCSVDELTAEVLKLQQQLAPFGVANPKPLYRVEDVSLTEVSLFGKGKEHTKLQFATSGIVDEAIAFFTTPEQFTKEPKVGQTVALVAHLEESFFMGRRQVRLRLVDILDTV